MSLRPSTLTPFILIHHFYPVISRHFICLHFLVSCFAVFVFVLLLGNCVKCDVHQCSIAYCIFIHFYCHWWTFVMCMFDLCSITFAVCHWTSADHFAMMKRDAAIHNITCRLLITVSLLSWRAQYCRYFVIYTHIYCLLLCDFCCRRQETESVIFAEVYAVS